MTTATLNPSSIINALSTVFRFSKKQSQPLYIDHIQSEPSSFDEATFQREMKLICEASALIQDELWNMETYSYQAGNIGNCYVAVVKWDNASDFELYVNHIQFETVSHAARYIAACNL